MNTLILDTDNQDILQGWLSGDSFVIACLCAAWCDTCSAYQSKFDDLAALHPDLHFAWIDIEDQAALVGELDISNFPTLLIQRKDIVCFFGTVQPDLRQADRLLRAQLEKTVSELAVEASSSEERRSWQEDCNLRTRMELN